MLLGNVLLKFQMLISVCPQYFLLKKCEAFAVQKLLSFFNKNIGVFGCYEVVKHLMC